ncbi:MAG: hypothetical protein ACJ8EA_26715, partial [Xanthobacteraceae bacterium]
SATVPVALVGVSPTRVKAQMRRVVRAFTRAKPSAGRRWQQPRRSRSPGPNESSALMIPDWLIYLPLLGAARMAKSPEERIMNKLLLALTTLVVAFGLTAPVFAADDEDTYEKKVKQVNALGEKPGRMKVCLQRISTETGVPVEKVQTQAKRHPEAGAAGLFLANLMADETKKEPEQFLKARENGKKWLTIAKNNKVSVDKLNERLDRFEKAIKGES